MPKVSDEPQTKGAQPDRTARVATVKLMANTGLSIKVKISKRNFQENAVTKLVSKKTIRLRREIHNYDHGRTKQTRLCKKTILILRHQKSVQRLNSTIKLFLMIFLILSVTLPATQSDTRGQVVSHKA